MANELLADSLPPVPTVSSALPVWLGLLGAFFIGSSAATIFFLWHPAVGVAMFCVMLLGMFFGQWPAAWVIMFVAGTLIPAVALSEDGQ